MGGVALHLEAGNIAAGTIMGGVDGTPTGSRDFGGREGTGKF